MTRETIERITARYVARLADAPPGTDEAILRGFINDLARDVASSVFLTSRNAVDNTCLPKLSEKQRAELSSRLEAFAVDVGCDFAQRVRASFFPEGTDQTIAEAERFAASSYWNALQLLLATVDKSGGRA